MRLLIRNTLLLLVLLAGSAIAGHHEKGALATALSGEARPAADRDRDAGRRPAQVLAFLGIGEGMTVIDLMASGGYYTEVLSHAVGAKGKVIAQNSARALQFRGGANDRAMADRASRLANISRLDKEIPDMGLAPGSIDAVMTALNLHDIYNGAGPEAAAGTLRLVHAALRSGGVLGVIDHDGNAGADNRSLHRMEMSQAVQLLEAAGFVLETSDLLRNPDDKRETGVFGPGIRGKTDRFLIKAVKP